MRSAHRTPITLRIALRLLMPALLVAAFSADTRASFISILAPTPTLAPGQSEVISILLTSTQDFTLQSSGFAFTIDSTRFSLTDVGFGTLSPTSGSLTRGFSFGGGTLGYDGGRAIAAGQVATLATFTVMARADAPAGAGLFNLQDTFISGSTTFVTRLNGGAIPLVPAPTNGFDPTLDATITVVPEPSSLALCGVAALAGLGFAARRRPAAG